MTELLTGTDLTPVNSRAMTDPDASVRVTFDLIETNYERLFSAAAHNGESMNDVLNRAVAMYERMTASKLGDRVKWADVDGRKRTVIVIR